jgi:hypothetical protein
VAAALASAPALAVRPAAAHPSDPQVRVVLDEVRPSIPDVAVSVVVSAAPQLVASNRTSEELTVLAETGEPFLRIGPDGVLANVDSPSWHLSNSPGGVATVPATASPDAPPRWVRVAVDPQWGWFDHRLHPEATTVPPEAVEAEEPTTLASWEVAFEYAGEPMTASGRIEYRPAAGRITARLAGADRPLPGVAVQVAPGPVPAVVLRASGTEPVTVLGSEGEPFARIGPGGVEVNRHSPLWVDNARAQERDPAGTALIDPAAPPDWLALSPATTFTWLEFRGAYPDPDPPRSARRATDPVVLLEWSVPLQVGGRTAQIEGETVWIPAGTGVDGTTDADPGSWLGRPTVAIAIVAAAAIIVLIVVGRRIAAGGRRKP